jgi:hypothetical protein
MRRIVEIPDDLFHRIELRLNQEDMNLGEFLVRAAERELARLRFPLVPSCDPGMLLSLTNSEIDDLPD